MCVCVGGILNSSVAFGVLLSRVPSGGLGSPLSAYPLEFTTWNLMPVLL